MQPSRKFTKILFALIALTMMATAALAADPGMPVPAESQISDQKAGSLLIYNYYTSGSTSGTTQNTRFNITNTNPTNAAFVHLFFVSSACTVADSFICLTQNQTASFLASDIDPAVTGYVVAFAVDNTGCPVSFNFLIGDEFVKLSTGHAANLGAEAVSALFTGRASNCNPSSGDPYVLTFNGNASSGFSYNQIPRVLAADSIPSRADGNDTLLIINRIGGNLSTGAATLGTLFGIIYDDSESAFSFSFNGGCQLSNSLSNAFPRTTPRIEQLIPAGRSGWLKVFNPNTDIGILGAIITSNSNAGSQPSAFTGGHNLHKLKLAASESYTIPVFPPSC